MRKSKIVPCFELEAALPALVTALRTRLVLKQAQLKTLKVPAPFLEPVLARLVQEGFEPIVGGVRVPLSSQLEALLASRTVISGPLGKLLKGGSPKEYKELVLAQARAGGLRLLVRGKAEAIAGRQAKVLAPEAMRALGAFALSVQKALRSKPLPRALLQEDVQELLLDLVQSGPARPESAPGAEPVAQSGQPEREELVELLVAQAGRLLQPELQLCFVPDLVLALLPDHGLARVHEALAQAVRRGRLELRPESGMNRLSQVELALCPPGLQGSRLSWVRPLEPRP